MPKATLEFNLDDPDDRNQHLLAIHAADWALVASAMDETLRSRLKYGHELKSANDALEFVRSQLHSEMDAHGISLDMIV